MPSLLPGPNEVWQRQGSKSITLNNFSPADLAAKYKTSIAYYYYRVRLNPSTHRSRLINLLISVSRFYKCLEMRMRKKGK